MAHLSIKAKLIGAMLACVLATSLAGLGLLQLSAERAMRQTAAQALAFGAQSFAALESKELEKLSAVLEPLLANSAVAELFAARDRERLLAATAPLFQKLKAQHGITHAYFIEPEPSQACFLRLHQPEDFGDRMDGPVMQAAVQSHQASAGKELGRTAFAVRVVRPFFAGEKLIGYLELGVDIGPFLAAIKAQTGSDFALVLDKSRTDQATWAAARRGLRDSWDDYKAFVLVDSTAPPEALVSAAVDPERLPDAGAVLDDLKAGGHRRVHGAFPLRDATGRKAGAIFVMQDAAAFDEGLREARVRGVIVTLLLALLGGVLAHLLARRIARPLQQMATAAARMAEGNLDAVPDSLGGHDEIATVANSFAKMAGRLSEMLERLRQTSGELKRSATALARSASEQTAFTQQQSTALHQTTTTAEEIAQTSRLAMSHADGVVQATERSQQLSRDGASAVEGAARGVESLVQQVDAIARAIGRWTERAMEMSGLIATVQDLAEQSNTLALNASIEAARAGESGRSFAVVAVEMRALAERSKAAVNKVRSILADVQKNSRAAIQAAQEGTRRARDVEALAHGAGDAIQGLARVISESSDSARQIAETARQQSLGVEQIASAMTEVWETVNGGVGQIQNMERASSELGELAQALLDLVGRYQAQASPPHPAPGAPGAPAGPAGGGEAVP